MNSGEFSPKPPEILAGAIVMAEGIIRLSWALDGPGATIPPEAVQRFVDEYNLSPSETVAVTTVATNKIGRTIDDGLEESFYGPIE
ncbi:MAG TPA: hypothetical protein VLF90_00650 [Patescibacteria group bacterium]|nr:hypothetical protein [Patescibacteria group bacterium]